MASSVQIKCINKDPRQDRYSAITHVGGFTDQPWKITLGEAIGYIEAGVWEFFTLVGGHRREVIVAIRNGRKYLRTTADHDTPDNLLSLPECP